MNAEQVGATLAAIDTGTIPAGFSPEYQVWRSEDSCGEFWEWVEVDRAEFDRAHPNYLGDKEYRRVVFIWNGWR